MSDAAPLKPEGNRFKLIGLGARSLLILFAAYLAFWLLATYAEQRARPAGFAAHRSIEFTPLSTTGQPLQKAGLQTAVYKAPFRYMSWRWDEDIAGARTAIAVPRYPVDVPLALMLSARSDVIAVRLNGHEVQPDIRDPRLPGAFVAEPSLYRLPSELRTGISDTLELEIRRSLRDPIIFPDFTIRPVAEVTTTFAWRNFMAVEAPLIGIVLSAFSILLYVIIAGPDSDRSRNLAFVGTLIFAAISSSIFLFFDQEQFDLRMYSYSITLVTFGLSICAVYFAYFETGYRFFRSRSLQLFLLGLLAVSTVVSMANYNGKAEHFVVFNAYITAQLFATGALVVATALLAWDISNGGLVRFAERFILIVCFGVIALDRSGPGLFTVYSPFSGETPLSLQWMPIIGSLVGIAMVFALAKHAEFARAEILSANVTLGIKLNEREAQLREIYASREKILAEQITLDERQRIMRDMHDGLGSNIMSMLLAARRGNAEPAKVADGLQGVIDEMRLMIDSMDSVGESLESAFAIFRDRVEPRVEAAGMEFVWQDHSRGFMPHYSPRDVLQVFRIMQEAVTNALKHSGGTRLTATLASSPEPGFALRLSISDDGAGLSKAERPGKGLASMATRAKSIGAELRVDGSAAGAAVVLDLPGSRNDATMP
jgi:two-component system sensor histidine kinase UhpB